MVEFPCWVHGCDFEVTDAPHIDACVQSFREHFRGAHPTKYLNARGTAEQASRFNSTFEEVMELNLGAQWADPQFFADALYYAQHVVRVVDGRSPTYRKSTVDAAQAWIDANQAQAQAQAQGVANAAPRRRFRPYPAR